MTERSAQEGYIPVTGGRVWYRVVGSGSGIPLLALHGGPGFGSDYFGPLESLADERQVIRYDQLGGGQSERPDDANLWRIERFVEELGQVRAALGLDQVHILGHSWGSTLATAYALTQPPGVRSLVLASPALSIPRFYQDCNDLKHQLPAEVQATLDQYATAGLTGSVEYQRAMMEFYSRHLCRLDWFLAGMQSALESEENGLNAQLYNTMLGPNEFQATGNLKDYDCTDRLNEIGVPVLFTCGRNDQCTPATTAWFHSLLPGSELVVFEESTHMPHLEETQHYLQVVANFLRQVEQQA